MPTREEERAIRRQLNDLATLTALTLLAILFAGPVAILVLGSVTADEQVLTVIGTGHVKFSEMTLENYGDVQARVPFWRYLLNTLVINASIVLGGLLINGLAGYSLARLRWRGRQLMLAIVLALLIIPFEAIAIPLFLQLSALGLRDTLLVQILPFVANPLSIFLFYSYFLRFPRELEEAARVDGASVLRIFASIVLPNSKAVFASVAIVTLLFSWGMYLWPLLITTSEVVRPLPLGIATFYTLPPVSWGDILAFGVLMISPLLLLFVILQRWFVQGVATTGLKR